LSFAICINCSFVSFDSKFQTLIYKMRWDILKKCRAAVKNLLGIKAELLTRMRGAE